MCADPMPEGPRVPTAASLPFSLFSQAPPHGAAAALQSHSARPMSLHAHGCAGGVTSDPQGTGGPGKRVSRLLWLGALVPGLLTSTVGRAPLPPEWAQDQLLASLHAVRSASVVSSKSGRAQSLMVGSERHQENQGQLGRMGHMPGPRDVPLPAPQAPP